MTTTLSPGDLVAGKYRVERVLGEGGMGVVVKATHVGLDQPVAIKLLRQEVRDKPAIVERFGREAKALAKLTSPHVTHVVDVANLPDGSPYIVMEYLDGVDLATVLERDGALPLTDAIDYVLEACEAIAEAHSVRVVHRDLKPANLFLARKAGESRPVVKVLDFGISKLLDDETQLTKTSSGLGSALYMSPEQMRNAKDCDERADVWALGVIVYELASARVPFGGESVHQVVANVLDQNRERLSHWVPSLPPEVDALVEECLVLDPKKRVRSVLEIAERLAPHGGKEARDSLERVRRFLGATTTTSIPPIAPIVVTRPDTDPTPSQRMELGSAKTEEHAITFPAPPTLPPPAPGQWKKLAIAGALVSVLALGGMLAAGAKMGSSAGSTPSAETPSKVTAEPPPSVAASSAVPPSAASASASSAVPTVVASPTDDKSGKKPDRPAPVPVLTPHTAPSSVAVAAPASAPQAPAPPAAPSAKPASTGGIVPISTMGIK